MNADPSSVFASLMQRPDIETATRQYQQLYGDLRTGLTAAIPTLTSWQPTDEASGAGCGSDYPGIGYNGATLNLPVYAAPVGVTDAQWELALTTIGRIAGRYGFNPTPQRLHDAPGNHDAMFHNVPDDGAIMVGTDNNIVLYVSVGCHLTAAAKKLGHLPETS